MPLARLQFELPKNSKPADYVEELITETKLVRDRDLEFSRIFLDTFDWRLFDQGFILVADSLEGRFRTTWQTLYAAEILGVLTSEQVPIFVGDLPGGRMQRILRPVMEMRALLPQSRLECVQQRLRLSNRNEKTVVRLNFESYTIEDTHGVRKKLCPRIYVEAVRGYDKAFVAIADWLQYRHNLHPPVDNLMVSALNKVGRHPRDYSSKFDFKLELSMRADSAVRIILRGQFSVLELNEHGTKQDIDSEFLHDFRVAIRRTRVLLGQSKDILPNALIDHYNREFAWLGKATGSVRDLDVYLLNFEGYRTALPVSIRNDLQPLQEFLEAKKKVAQSELVTVLKSRRYERLKKEWRQLLARTIDEKPFEFLAATRVQQIADARIWRVYTIVRQKGRTIGPDTPAARLHRLRIHCKKLRYLIEFFGSLYPEKQIRRTLKSLKELQDNLGSFQDLEVQVKTLQQYSSEMMASRIEARTLLAMGVLVQELEKQCAVVRTDFVQRFDDFDSAENRKLFTSLFENER